MLEPHSQSRAPCATLPCGGRQQILQQPLTAILLPLHFDDHSGNQLLAVQMQGSTQVLQASAQYDPSNPEYPRTPSKYTPAAAIAAKPASCPMKDPGRWLLSNVINGRQSPANEPSGGWLLRQGNTVRWRRRECTVICGRSGPAKQAATQQQLWHISAAATCCVLGDAVQCVAQVQTLVCNSLHDACKVELVRILRTSDGTMQCKRLLASDDSLAVADASAAITLTRGVSMIRGLGPAACTLQQQEASRNPAHRS
jgi:hypothetical protein